MVKLRRYQKQGRRFMHEHDGRVLLADDMGLGKTVQVLSYVKKHDAGRLLVVCPASVKYHWAAEAEDKFGLTAYVCEGMTPPPDFDARRYDVVVINYRILKQWYSLLRKGRFKVVAIDECQNLRNRSSQQTIWTRRLCKGRRHVIACSGTPIENRPAEFWPVLNILWPRTYKRFLVFAMWYCKPRKVRGRWEYKGAANLDRLHRNLVRRGMIRRRREDVLGELPPLTTEMVLLDIARRSEYDKAEKNVVKWLRRRSAVKASRAQVAEGLSKMTYLKELVGRLKLKEVERWIDEFLASTPEKLAVFYWHRKVGKALRARYGAAACLVDGSVTGRKRRDQVEAFVRNPRKRLFLGNLHAAGVGLDGLQKVCRFGAFAEYGWKPTDFSQVMARLNRMGQTRGTVFYFLTARGTVEHTLCKVVQGKQRVLDAALDGKELSDLRIYNMLEEALMRKGDK